MHFPAPPRRRYEGFEIGVRGESTVRSEYVGAVGRDEDEARRAPSTSRRRTALDLTHACRSERASNPSATFLPLWLEHTQAPRVLLDKAALHRR